ncbi:stalk domain-containing protein [Brevibacillus thermoruber]|uniref:stalk domain-containing protein n=1 Tax=Brevibacillus thermoruber TaxID=33942 RepID=UPI0004200F56|nr:protease complex subunit PrcB family protein [Brevibacillus thermoruber]
MKWKKAVACAVGLQLLLAIPAGAAVNAKITVNGHAAQWKHEAITVNQRTYTAAEDVSGILQAAWQVEGDTGVLTLPSNRTLAFKLHTDEAAVDGKWTTIEHGARQYNGTVYLPLRWVIEQAGLSIRWNPSTKEVDIVKPKGDDDAFKVLENALLSAEEKAFVQKVKEQRGVHKLGSLYVIALGQAPNPGYGLKVTGTEWSLEQLKVYVKQTKPDPGRIYAQVITYPYLIARAKLPPNTTVQFYDADTKQPLFQQQMNSQPGR